MMLTTGSSTENSRHAYKCYSTYLLLLRSWQGNCLFLSMFDCTDHLLLLIRLAVYCSLIIILFQQWVHDGKWFHTFLCHPCIHNVTIHHSHSYTPNSINQLLSTESRKQLWAVGQQAYPIDWPAVRLITLNKQVVGSSSQQQRKGNPLRTNKDVQTVHASLGSQGHVNEVAYIS